MIANKLEGGMDGLLQQKIVPAIQQQQQQREAAFRMASHRRWSMAATTIQRGHLRHVFLLRMIANRLEGGMDTLAATTTSIVWDGLL